MYVYLFIEIIVLFILVIFLSFYYENKFNISIKI